MTALHDVALIDISQFYLYSALFIYLYVYTVNSVFCIVAVCGVQLTDAFLGSYCCTYNVNDLLTGWWTITGSGL